MSTCIYSRKNYIIIKASNKKDRYIIYNKSKDFDKAHTHINDYHLAKSIINYLLTGKANLRLKNLIDNNEYIKESIRRIK